MLRSLSALWCNHWSAFVLDKDGTLVHHGEAIPGAADFITRLDSLHLPYVIMSNTGERDNRQVAEDLGGTLGVRILPSRIHTAKECLTDVLASASFDKIFTIGRHDLPGCGALPSIDSLKDLPGSSKICLALFSDGLLEDFCQTLTVAAHLLLHMGATLYATSADATITRSLPCGTRVSRPGPGVFVASLRTMGVPEERIRILGKGHDPSMATRAMHMLREQGYTGPAQGIVVVGDRFDTDVRAGGFHGWSTCLVESGCHTIEQQPLYPSDVADAVAASVRDLAVDSRVEMADLIVDLVRCAVRAAPSSQRITNGIASIMRRLAMRLDAHTPLLPPRRIMSVPHALDAWNANA